MSGESEALGEYPDLVLNQNKILSNLDSENNFEKDSVKGAKAPERANGKQPCNK